MRKGITENYWNQRMQEHHRFFWTALVYIVSAVAAASIRKTPYSAVNIFLSIYVGLNSIFIIHFHRKFSNFPSRYRRIVSRYSLRMFLSGWYVVAAGCTIVAILLMFRLIGFPPDTAAFTTSWHDLVLVLAVALLIASMWLGELKEWGWFAWLFTFPREAFLRHIALRSFHVDSFRGFAAFELYVVSYSFLFVFLFSALLQVAVVLYGF